MRVTRNMSAVSWTLCVVAALCAMHQCRGAESEGPAGGSGEFTNPDTHAADSGSFETPSRSSERPLDVTNRPERTETAGEGEGQTPTNGDLQGGDNADADPQPVEAAPTQGAQPATGEAKPADGAAAESKQEKKDEKISLEFSDKPKEEGGEKVEKGDKDKDCLNPEEMEALYSDPPNANGVLEGYVGWKDHNRLPKSAIDNDNILPIADRWRLGMHPDSRKVRGSLWDPFHQNMLKGDYPIIGQSIFMSVLAVSDTLVEGRSVPTPANVSTARPNNEQFFGRPDQFIFNQNFIVSIELFKGETDFKPREWEFRLTPVFNINYVDVEENFVLNIDPRKGSDRLDHQLAFAELFGEYHFRDISPSYDFMSSRTGIQHYNEDFRGFLFDDFNLGVRVFGTYEANRLQYNFAAFEMLDKDTNSGLNSTFEFKDEHVLLANLVRQDTFFKGYSVIGNLAYSDEESTVQYNQNGVIVRPTPVGDLQPHSNKVGYIGVGGDGHIGRLNLTHQFYQAFGSDSRNPLSGKRSTINAQMFALEASVDYDWMRFRSSFFYASGDKDPYDKKAGGFDAIFDNPNFAGGGFSYWVRQGFGAGNALTSLKSRFSLLPNLSSSSGEGQASFVNPGIEIYNLAYDAELTPRLKATLNYNYIQFSDTSSLETLLQQDGIDRKLGHDYGIGMTYRPWLNQQVVLTGGVAGFTPMAGFKDVYTSNETLYSAFLNILVKY